MTSTGDPYNDTPWETGIWRPDGPTLVELGFLAVLPPINATRWLYTSRPEGNPPGRCQHAVEVPIRERGIWCPACRLTEQPPSYLQRTWTAPNMHQVWHSHFNLTTGKEESDPRKFEDSLRRSADRQSEITNIEHTYTRSDPTEIFNHRAEQGESKRGHDPRAGLKSTHDRAVAEGRKEPTGKTTWW